MRLPILLGIVCLVLAPGAHCEPAEEPRLSRWKFGGELDVLSYATKGYYGSFFAGRGSWRGRAIVSRVNPPGFANPEGFDRRVDAYVVAVDRFFGSRRGSLEGLWIGPGVEIWRNRVKREGANEYAFFNNFVPTIGVGYVWKLSKHMYVNPWAAGHFVAAGTRSVEVGGGTYEQRRFHSEASLKVGFVF